MPSSLSGLPYAMQRTPVRSGNGRHSLANGFDQRLQVLQRAPREHAMTEIEYVARAAACAAEHVARAFGDTFDRSEQHRRVQVPLHAQGIAEAPPATCAARYSAMTVASLSSSSPNAAGSWYMNCFVSTKSRLGRPSMA